MVGYCHQRDHVAITYDDKARRYHVQFEKAIRNTSAQPVHWFYARITVAVFPGDKELNDFVYGGSNLTPESIDLIVEDHEGELLAYDIARQHPANLELHIKFAKSASKRPVSLQPGETRIVRYSCNIPDLWWGPWLQRDIRIPTDLVSIELNFPQDLVEIWAEEQCPHRSGWAELNGEVKSQKSGQRVRYTWSKKQPGVRSLFKFQWEFRDGRHTELAEKIRQEQLQPRTSAEGVANIEAKRALSAGLCWHAEDYSAIRWYGRDYSLTRLQRSMMKLLWEAWIRGGSAVSHDSIIEAAHGPNASTGRVRDILRTRDVNEIVEIPTKGMYRLKSFESGDL